VTRLEKRDLEALVLRLADGDRSAFDPLYDALWPVVQSLTQRMLRGSPEAQDAAQEAMLKVFARASHFEPGRDVKTWVLAVTAYECKTLRQRSRRRREQHTPLDTRVDEHASPEDAVIAEDLKAAAQEVLGTLSPHDIEALGAVMSGERPELSPTTFRKRLERAVKRLRTAWSSRHGLD